MPVAVLVPAVVVEAILHAVELPVPHNFQSRGLEKEVRAEEGHREKLDLQHFILLPRVLRISYLPSSLP